MVEPTLEDLQLQSRRETYCLACGNPIDSDPDICTMVKPAVPNPPTVEVEWTPRVIDG